MDLAYNDETGEVECGMHVLIFCLMCALAGAGVGVILTALI